MQYDGHHDHYHAEEQPRVDDFRVGRRGQLLQTVWSTVMVSPLLVSLPNLLNTRGDGGHGQKQNGIDHDSVRKVV